MSSTLSAEAKNFNWLLDSFAAGTAGVVEAIAVSSDGLLMAMTTAQERAACERLAAVVSGLTSLAAGASTCYPLGGLNRVILDMEQGYLLVTSISSGSVLGVIAERSANLGTLAYEMTLFANKAGGVLTPTLIDELKSYVRA